MTKKSNKHYSHDNTPLEYEETNNQKNFETKKNHFSAVNSNNRNDGQFDQVWVGSLRKILVQIKKTSEANLLKLRPLVVMLVLLKRKKVRQQGSKPNQILCWL